MRRDSSRDSFRSEKRRGLYQRAKAPDAHDVRGEDFRAKNGFFRLDKAAAGDGGRGTTMGASAGKRRCTSTKASGLPTKNRSARPELQNAFGPTLRKGRGTRKSRFLTRRREARNDNGRTGWESEESCREWRLASGSGAAFHHAHRFQAHDNFFVLI